MPDCCDGLLNTEAICEYLGCSRNTAYKWIARGLPVIKEGSREYSSSKRAIDEFFLHRTLAAVAPGDKPETPPGGKTKNRTSNATRFVASATPDIAPSNRKKTRKKETCQNPVKKKDSANLIT